MKQEFQYAIELRLFDDRIILVNLICQLCFIVWLQIWQWSHLVHESWTARRAVIRWRQVTT